MTAGEPRATGADRPFWHWIAAATLLGLAIRLVAVALASRQLPLADGLWYHGQANLIADGRAYINPFAHSFLGTTRATAEHPPLFPLLLSVTSWLARPTVLAHQITTAFLGAAGIPVLGALGRRVGGRRVGIVAMLIVAVLPNFWRYEVQVLAESALLLVFGLLLLAIHRWWDRRTFTDAALVGLAIGAGALTRPELLLLGVLLIVPLMIRTPHLAGAGVRWRHLLVAGAVTSAVIAPWVVRNLVTFDETVLFTTNQDAVIAGANCEPMWNGPGIGSWTISCFREVVRTDEDESTEYARARSRGVEYAKQHWERAPIVAAARAGRAFDVFRPFQGLGEDGQFKVIGVGSVVGFYALALAGVIGIRRLRRAGQLIYPPVATAGFVLVLSILTYGLVRLRVPLDVALVVPAAVALVSSAPASSRTQPEADDSPAGIPAAAADASSP